VQLTLPARPLLSVVEHTAGLLPASHHAGHRDNCIRYHIMRMNRHNHMQSWCQILKSKTTPLDHLIHIGQLGARLSTNTTAARFHPSQPWSSRDLRRRSEDVGPSGRYTPFIPSYHSTS